MTRSQLCVECGNDGKKGMHHFENETLALDENHTINNMSGWRCVTCGMTELDDESMERYAPASDALVHQKNAQWEAAQQEELKRIRKKLKLTKSDAADLIANSMNLFRLLDHHPELLKEIRPT